MLTEYLQFIKRHNCVEPFNLNEFFIGRIFINTLNKEFRISINTLRKEFIADIKNDNTCGTLQLKYPLNSVSIYFTLYMRKSMEITYSHQHLTT